MYCLKNKKGLEIHFMAYGGKLCSVLVPSEKGKTDLLAGYETEQEFLNGDPFLGALIGRYANRIANGVMSIDGKKINLNRNYEPDHLHGGKNGFYSRKWNIEAVDCEEYTTSYKLSLLNKDGEEEYPGNLKVEVLYALNENNEFLIDFKAQTDKTTVVNLTSHPYFNLNGPGGGDIKNHYLQIFADAYTPAKNQIPTGEIKDVSGTVMDFRSPRNLKEVLQSDDDEIIERGGLDHNWVIRRQNHDLVRAAVLFLPDAKRKIEVFTTHPGIQVYTGMHFSGEEKGKGGFPIIKYGGIALEPQNFPDAPNKANFPKALLQPGEEYHEQIVYRFEF